MPAASPECFYLHIDGEQRGPYTISQIDHLLNSGLIREETTYWREGMEQWRPVTDLVQMVKKPVRSWLRPGIVLVLIGALILLGRIFGPVTLEGWRETAQYDFTPRAAYWRARDAVRTQGAPSGAVISFGGMKTARIDMQTSGAKVLLPTEISSVRGGAGIVVWEVELSYDAKAKLWTAVSVKEAPGGT